MKATSRAVNGLPSCHFTPFFSLKVYVSPSFDTSHDSARSGRTLSFSSSSSRLSKRGHSAMYDMLSVAMTGFSEVASPLSPITKSFPCADRGAGVTTASASIRASRIAWIIVTLLY